MSLFRKQAIENKQMRWIGKIVVIRPLSISVMTALAMAVLCLIFSILVGGSYTKRSVVPGRVIPIFGQSKVYSPQLGTVLEKHVHEGQNLKKGDLLYVVSSERYAESKEGVLAMSVNSLRRRYQSLKEELDRLALLNLNERSIAQQRIDGLRQEVRLQEEQKRDQHLLIALANDAVSRYQRLLNRGYISLDQLQLKRSEHLVYVQALRSLERSHANLTQQLAERKAEFSGLDTRHQVQRANIERQLAALELDLTELEAKRRIAVLAPASGKATAVMAEVGHNVDSRLPLLVIVPADLPFEIELFMTSKAVGFIQPGDRVNIRYAAYPYQKFGVHRGSVISISTATLPAGEALELTDQAHSMVAGNEALYRVRVQLESQTISAYGKIKQLRSGMRVDAVIFHESRRLYEWALDPLYRVTARASEH